MLSNKKEAEIKDHSSLNFYGYCGFIYIDGIYSTLMNTASSSLTTRIYSTSGSSVP